jgi:uncharacterized membrane protein
MRRLLTKALGAFLTGLLFLLPIILTVVVLDWAAGYVRRAVGPESFIGGAIVSGGSVLVGDKAEVLAFWVGLALVLVAIGAIGAVVQTRFRKRIEAGFDRLIDRVPLLRSVYRPIAQIVRLMGPDRDGGDLKGMSVVSVRFGQGADFLCLLVAPQSFEVAGEARKLILIPTAPVPMGGAMLFVPEAAVAPVPGLGIEDFMKFYVSMGTALPDALRQP